MTYGTISNSPITGCREAEVCRLRWDWELSVPELSTSAFIVPAHTVKNRTDRLVVLNRVAESVIDSVRGEHPDHVFTSTVMGFSGLTTQPGAKHGNGRNSRTYGCTTSSTLLGDVCARRVSASKTGRTF